MSHRAAGPEDAGETEHEEGCGDYDGQVAKNLHSSTLHGWDCGHSKAGEADFDKRGEGCLWAIPKTSSNVG